MSGMANCRFPPRPMGLTGGDPGLRRAEAPVDAGAFLHSGNTRAFVAASGMIRLRMATFSGDAGVNDVN